MAAAKGSKRKITDFFGHSQPQPQKGGAGLGFGLDPDDPSSVDAVDDSRVESGAACSSASSPVPLSPSRDPDPGDSLVDIEFCDAPSSSHVTEPSTASVVPFHAAAPASKSHQINDIGLYVGKSLQEVGDCTVKQLLENHWMPPPKYSFPFSVHVRQGKTEHRFIGHRHLQSFEWAVLSPKDEGLYCKFCVFFATGHTGGLGKGTPLRALVTEPLRKFAKLTGKDGALDAHSKMQYHVQAVEAGINFLRSKKNPHDDVRNQVDSQRLKQVRENRERLNCIVESIELLGRQGLALRGHREGSSKTLNDPTYSNNEGNFREFLKFRASKEKIVKEHLSSANASSRSMYTSMIIQNELIECCGRDILRQILQRVAESKYYSIIFDETTDISHMSQMSLNLRYVHSHEGEIIGIREDCLMFVDPRKILDDNEKAIREYDEDDGTASLRGSESEAGTSDITDDETTDNELVDTEQVLSGVKLGGVVLRLLRENGLDVKMCVGIGSDGCSVNTSDTIGAVQEIQKEAVNAVRTPCFNHALNLSISKSSDVASVKKVVALMKEVGSFFGASSKRHKILKKRLKRSLPKLCETRWVERHDAVLVFYSNFKQILTVLSKISGWQDSTTAAKATALRSALREPEFVVTLICLRDALSATIGLSRLLQKEYLELQTASGAVLDTLSVLEEKRRNAEEIFGVLFDEAFELAEKIGIELKRPRAAGRGRHPTEDEEGYFRQTIFIPLLDAIIQDMKTRLSPEVLNCYELNSLLPTEVLAKKNRSKAALSGFAERYHNLFSTDAESLKVTVQSEWDNWYAIWSRVKATGGKVPESALESLDMCDNILFPTIRNLLLILVTLPASVATAERTFSTLRRIKSWLRSTMGESRLNGLALMHMHRDIKIDKAKVIEEFASRNARRKKKLVM